MAYITKVINANDYVEGTSVILAAPNDSFKTKDGEENDGNLTKYDARFASLYSTLFAWLLAN